MHLLFIHVVNGKTMAGHLPGGAGAGSLQNGNDKRPRVSRGASVDPWAMLQKNGELNKDMIYIYIYT